MKWSHLPVDGGIYDQHPLLLEQWRYIFSERNKYEAEQERKREQENRNKTKQQPRGRSRASRSR